MPGLGILVYITYLANEESHPLTATKLAGIPIFSPYTTPTNPST